MVLERFNYLFAYNCDFSQLFNFSLCLTCHSQYNHTKKGFDDTGFSSATTSVTNYDKKSNKNTDVFLAINVSNDDFDLTDSILSEEDNFGIFQDSLVKHIQICINGDNFNKDNIQVFYKINVYAIIQVLQLQLPHIVALSSGSISSCKEFFKKLDKNYNDNSNGAYLDLISIFEEERITVNAIKDLS
ncbi:12746_t:CDS:2, partial [Cetraspora pellucida]